MGFAHIPDFSVFFILMASLIHIDKLLLLCFIIVHWPMCSHNLNLSVLKLRLTMQAHTCLYPASPLLLVLS